VCALPRLTADRISRRSAAATVRRIPSRAQVLRPVQSSNITPSPVLAFPLQSHPPCRLVRKLSSVGGRPAGPGLAEHDSRGGRGGGERDQVIGDERMGRRDRFSNGGDAPKGRRLGAHISRAVWLSVSRTDCRTSSVVDRRASRAACLSSAISRQVVVVVVVGSPVLIERYSICRPPPPAASATNSAHRRLLD